MKILTRSDQFQQIKPHRFSYLETLQNSGSRYSFYQFPLDRMGEWYLTSPDYTERYTFSSMRLRFTNYDVFRLLSKSISMVRNTEEYTRYLLEETFSTDPSQPHRKQTPPGTVRFYAKDLICYYTGKTWKKLEV